jgi:malate synthase
MIKIVEEQDRVFLDYHYDDEKEATFPKSPCLILRNGIHYMRKGYLTDGRPIYSPVSNFTVDFVIFANGF